MNLPGRKQFSSGDLSLPWRQALESGDLPDLESLREAGCSVEAPLIRGRPGSAEWSETPLIVAIQAGSEISVRFLLENGADVEASGSRVDVDQEFEELVPLHLAVRNNHPELARLLLEAGANPNRVVKRESGGGKFLPCREIQGFGDGAGGCR